MNTAQAFDRMVGFLQDGYPQITTPKHPHELEDVAKWWEDFADRVNDLAHAVADDASAHVSNIKPQLLRTFVVDAFHDADVAGELRSEAYDIRESAREAAE